ncbi:PD40 domain-containing protein [Nocardioides sediminis]|uniref:PD40 domain-containing protein n=1 Tax=Nocardioides sediminis TaxID=433648 RepID=UPI000D31FDD0|nr:PD40 domain-containing protein [Nocardioides sediminis]
MSASEETWAARLHAAVDEHPGALAFDVPSYVAAGRKRARRNRVLSIIATTAAVAVIVAGTTLATGVTFTESPQPAAPGVPHSTALGAGTNGWVAVDAWQGGGEVYLVRPGADARPLEVAGSDGASEACPAWSPDGRRLLFGRLSPPSGSRASDAELVIVPVDRSGTAGTPTVIALQGFDVLEGHDPHPCGTWAPDGRWVALAGAGEVWVVDTQAGAIRRLPDLRPSDLEWRPGTDELAIAGDMGTSRADPTVSAPVRVYSLSTREIRQLGSVEAAHLTWSPDGATLAYTGGETDQAELRLVDGDGTNERLLHADVGETLHGIGPVWSPTGDRIAYQRLTGDAERHEVVLTAVADGSETVIDAPEADGRFWYPFTVSWSPDGSTLLYAAWTEDDDALPGGVIAVPADEPSDVTVLTDAIDPVPNYYSHQWTPIQMWGRQSG